MTRDVLSLLMNMIILGFFLLIVALIVLGVKGG